MTKTAPMTTPAPHPPKRSLADLAPGESGVIESIDTPLDVFIKLLEMGLGPGETVRLIRRAPFGDPIEVEILESRLAIRHAEARLVYLMPPASGR